MGKGRRDPGKERGRKEASREGRGGSREGGGERGVVGSLVCGLCS